jgi:uncharacterized protein YjbI with pentapeptide repeats
VTGRTTHAVSITEDLSNTKFDPPSTDVRFVQSMVTRVDFAGLQLWRLGSDASVFVECSFDSVRLEAGALGLTQGARFVDCSFADADLRAVRPGYARFETCAFSRAKIEEWFTFCSEFIDCSFDRANISGCKFSARPRDCFGLFEWPRRRRNEFRGNDFRGATLINTFFVDGIDLDDQKLPQSRDYLRINDASQRIRDARRRVGEIARDEETSRAVRARLETLEFLARDQEHVFLRRAELDLPQDVRERFVQILASNSD